MDKHGRKEYKSKFDFEAFKTKLENNEFTKEDVQKLFYFASLMEERMFSILDACEMTADDCITDKVYEEGDSPLIKEIKKLQRCNEWSHEQSRTFYEEI